MRISAFSILAALALALPASAQTLKRIANSNQLNLGYRTDAAPLSFAEKNGQPAGYTPLICVGVAQAIADHLEIADLKINFLPVDTNNRFEKVASGEIDLLCGAATITLERRKLVDFSVPTYIDGAAVLVAKGTARELSDLAGKKLGVRSGTTTETVLLSSLKQANIQAETFRFADHNAGLNALGNREIDAYFADQSILIHRYFSENMADRYEFPDQLLTLEKHGLAMARDDGEFRLLVDTALSALFANGTMENLFREAFPGATPGQAVQAMYLISPTMP